MPITIAVSAVFFATLFASLVVLFGLHHDGAFIVGISVVIAVGLSTPAAYIQYKREAVFEAQKQALHGLASTDALTGIMNRRSFHSAVCTEQARMDRTGDTAAIILFDLDWFKRINDTHGHDAGDKVLVAVAEVAWAELRNPLDYLARWGGEEFAIFLNGVSVDLAKLAAERLRRAIEELNVYNGGDTINVTASFGITQLSSSKTFEQAIRQADRALYMAKRSGRNTTIIYANTDETEATDEQAA
ncbi:MAG: GGDEF domain-containing protein [Pseudomonadota bacterium]